MRSRVTPGETTEPGWTRETVLGVLRDAISVGASEIHFKVPGQVVIRIGDRIAARPTRRLIPADTIQIAHVLGSLAGREVALTSSESPEFSFGVMGVGRFQATLYHQRGSVAILVRRAALEPPTLASAGAPTSLAGNIGKPGLVLLCGPARTQWLHAAVHSFNATTAGTLCLVEDRLGYLHRDEHAFIAHREIGQDVENFSAGVGQADRLGADLIAVGDVPDEAAAEAILAAAERGRSIIAAVPARDADHGPVWFGLRFLGERRVDARDRLASVLVKAYTCVSPGQPG